MQGETPKNIQYEYESLYERKCDCIPLKWKSAAICMEGSRAEGGDGLNCSGQSVYFAHLDVKKS